MILTHTQKWYVFKNVSELFILVPALLGLKGNLDMCLASRLSTQVNLGNMSSRSNVVRMIVGNIALVQVQATVASFLVAMFAMSVGAAMTGSFYFENAMLLTASAMFTATSSCFVLDFVLVAVILFSQKYNLNPDNLATPLAASIGDVVSISLLSFIASLLYDNISMYFPFPCTSRISLNNSNSNSLRNTSLQRPICGSLLLWSPATWCCCPCGLLLC